jgi:hypothetical protein
MAVNRVPMPKKLLVCLGTIATAVPRGSVRLGTKLRSSFNLLKTFENSEGALLGMDGYLWPYHTKYPSLIGKLFWFFGFGTGLRVGGTTR